MRTEAAASAGTVRAARVAVTAVFFGNGLLFASWTAHIPHVKARLGLSDGTLGLALLGAPLGSVAAMLLAGYLLPRFGSRPIVQASLVGYCAAGPVVGVIGTPVALFAALFGWGGFQGSLDVAMNTQAIAIERSHRRVLMSGLHASWSIGAFAGAGIGAIAVGLGVTLRLQLLLLASATLLGVGLLTVRLLPDAAGATASAGPARTTYDDAAVPATRPRSPARWPAGLLVLGAIAFASMLCEGAAADWAAVYLHGSLGAVDAVAGLGYATFALSMVAVRLCGNRLFARHGAHRVLPPLAAVATLGFGAALLLGAPAAALAGFACLGAGLASVVPAVFSAAGRIARLHAGTAVALVSACGWLGFVCGPPVIGQLAELTSLPAALWVLPALTALITLATAHTPLLRGAGDATRAPEPRHVKQR